MWISDAINNTALAAPISALVISQIIKLFVLVGRGVRPSLRHLFTSGGIPSTHAAVVSALATAIGLNEGISSALFGIVVVLALVVLYVAIVRRKWGEVSEVTKQASDKDAKSKKDSANQVVLNGHTPLEVLLGVALGIAVAYLWVKVIGGRMG